MCRRSWCCCTDDAQHLEPPIDGRAIVGHVFPAVCRFWRPDDSARRPHALPGFHRHRDILGLRHVGPGSSRLPHRCRLARRPCATHPTHHGPLLSRLCAHAAVGLAADDVSIAVLVHVAVPSRTRTDHGPEQCGGALPSTRLQTHRLRPCLGYHWLGRHQLGLEPSSAFLGSVATRAQPSG